jgi:hypothetical protein
VAEPRTASPGRGAAIATFFEDACWTAQRDRLLIGAVDALHDTSDVPEPQWEQLAAEFSEAELLDLLMLCGWYHAISFAARATRLERQSWAPAFTATAPGVVVHPTSECEVDPDDGGELVQRAPTPSMGAGRPIPFGDPGRNTP